MMSSLPVDPTDPRSFRTAVGHYPAGITVITCLDGHQPVGFTCQSFHSVSVEPPLVSFCVMRNSTTYPVIRSAGTFVVNVLADDQHRVSGQFALKGSDKWAGVGWSSEEARGPVLQGSLLWLDCTVQAEHRAGDHFLVIGKVEAMGHPVECAAAPMVFYRGRYRRLDASNHDVT